MTQNKDKNVPSGTPAAGEGHEASTSAMTTSAARASEAERASMGPSSGSPGSGSPGPSPQPAKPAKALASRKQNAARESSVFLLVVAAVLVALNVLGVFFSFRIDLTEHSLFSLSEGSKRVVRGLDDRMEVVAYFTDDLPPPFNATERYVRDVLAEYESASEGRLRVRFVNPDSDEKSEAAEKDGVQRVSHQVVENDSVSMREGYRGLVIKYLGENEVIPVIEDTSGLEYRITQKIKSMTGDRLSIALVSGKGGLSLNEGLSTLKRFLPNYDVQEMEASALQAGQTKAALLLGPTSAFSDEELVAMERYVQQGGSLGVFSSAFKVSLQGAPAGELVDTGLNKLLTDWGVEITNAMVADSQCTRAPMQGPMGIPMAVPYPVVPIAVPLEETSDHPAVFGVPSVTLPFASVLKEKGKKVKGVDRKVLVRSSENSWALEGSNLALEPKHPRDWDQSGPAGPFPMVIALEGKFPASVGSGKPEAKGRVLVVGSSEFMRDELLPQGQQQGGAEQALAVLAFALNAVDWLSQDEDLIAVRAKNVEDPPLEVPLNVTAAEDAAREAAEQRDAEKMEKELEKRKEAMAAWDKKKAAYRWFNTLGVPFLFAMFGIWRWRRRAAASRVKASSHGEKPGASGASSSGAATQA